VILACVLAGGSFAAIGDPPPPACATDVMYETFELGAAGWAHFPMDFYPVEYDTWHLASMSCAGDDLGSTMFVSDGNCPSGWGHERSELVSPEVGMPISGTFHLAFDAVSYDEGGPCLSPFPSSYDLKDAGISVTGGWNWHVLNDCWALTPDGTAVGGGDLVSRQFDISGFAGQTINVVFAYDTVDADVGHTFAVDNVRIIQGDTDEDGVGAACDCLPVDGTVWDLPGETTNLVLSHAPPGPWGVTRLDWAAAASGGLPEATAFDVIRSLDPADFVSGSDCVASDAGPEATASDEDTPEPGELFHYSVRAQNPCGAGIAGTDSNDSPRPARLCP